jgi:hypothetical protein
LSIDHMTRNLHRGVGWIACALGLLLASQLVQAGSPCVSMSSGVSRAVMQSPCATLGVAKDDCVVGAPRIDAGATAPLPPEVPPVTEAPNPQTVFVRVRAEDSFFTGPAPGPGLPLHILFHRHLI